jgi:signal transduction histidine kinase
MKKEDFRFILHPYTRGLAMGNDKDKSRQMDAAKLREEAEKRLRTQMAELYPTRSEEDSQRLVHELEVHQIELEMQNTELREARDELEAALEKYADLYDFAPVGYFTLDRDTTILAANLTGATLLGVERSLLIGRLFGLFVLEENRPTFAAFLDTVFTSKAEETCEVALLKGGSHQLFVQIEALAASDGQECRVALFDITGRRNLENQLLQAQKLETVGLLAGGIAHDFNDILNVIVGYGSFLEMDMQKDKILLGKVKQILSAAQRGTILTRSLLNFSRRQLVSPQPTDVNGILRDLNKYLTMLLGEDVRLKTVCEEKILKVSADSGQIEQVLINLATNARHAMPDGGTLMIATESFAINPEFIKAHGFGEPGDYALISVTDTGTGMDRETIGRVFDPFFTTETTGIGTGLGLSIVYSLVKQHNGYIDVTSKPNQGTTFRIYLPLTREENVSEAQPSLPLPWAGAETILLAEDDEGVRFLTEQLLTGFGYRVISAVDGEDAVKKYFVHKDSIQMLLFDLIMPKRNGKEAYYEIRKVCPGVRVLFMSGYTSDIIRAKDLEDGAEILTKPFSPTELGRKVRTVLDGEQSGCS